jgi:hypothetical protein
MEEGLEALALEHHTNKQPGRGRLRRGQISLQMVVEMLIKEAAESEGTFCT